MEENKTVVAPAEAKSANPTGNPNYGPQGSRSSERPGSRKFPGKGKPGERRGGRGGFRREEDDFKDRVVNINRISTTTKGGKHMRFDALVVIGDYKGRYGFGLAKSIEVPDAIKKSLASAKKSTYGVKLVKGGTIAHEVWGKFGKTSVFLKPAPEGTGIVAGGAVRAVLELCGVKNVVSKVYGSRTPINVIRATHAGLQALKNREKQLALRGIEVKGGK